MDGVEGWIDERSVSCEREQKQPCLGTERRAGRQNEGSKLQHVLEMLQRSRVVDRVSAVLWLAIAAARHVDRQEHNEIDEDGAGVERVFELEEVAAEELVVD